jgi:predicted phosphodiesterase
LTVKILALYDIHGNPDALGAVLADPRAANPDVVVIGGDAVPGPEARATLDRLEAVSAPVRYLRGNASPRRDDEMLTRLSTAQRYNDALRGVDAGLIVAGHTHQQDDRIVAGKRFVNAGSIGLPDEGDGAARWLWIDDRVPELRITAYDAASAGARFLTGGWPDERSVRAALIDGNEPIVITRMFESTVRQLREP